MVGCDDKITKDDIPSYLAIDTIILSTDYSNQGTASNKITDAWVYVDNNLIGAFELPAKAIPILAEGTHTITISSGIKLNGIASTRARYAYYKNYTVKINLVRDSIIKIHPTTTYTDNTIFEWMEDFEDGSTSLERGSSSQAGLERISTDSLVFEGSNCGKAVLRDSSVFFEVKTISAFDLPLDDSPVYLELNYRNNIDFWIGFYANEISVTTQRSILKLNPTNEWKKIYFNLTPWINQFTNAKNFNIFFGFNRNYGDPEGIIYLDNIKLVHR
jgi:hypothetical protein